MSSSASTAHPKPSQPSKRSSPSSRERIGRLGLAVVLDYDVALSQLPADERDDALGHLDAASTIATEHLGWQPETLVLAGSPAATLTRFATEHDYRLVAIGSRGHGASKLAFGSVASHLSRHAGEVPVLVVSRRVNP